VVSMLCCLAVGDLKPAFKVGVDAPDLMLLLSVVLDDDQVQPLYEWRCSLVIDDCIFFKMWWISLLPFNLTAMRKR
jgi:hypothetical protein